MKKIILLFAIFTCISVFSQTSEYVFVYFKDKPKAKEFLDNPLSELTQKALDRRTKLGVKIDETDAPIHGAYVEDVRTTLGLEKIKSQSKWLNGVAVEVTSQQKAILENKEYVKNIESFVRNPSASGQFEKLRNKFDNEILFGNSDKKAMPNDRLARTAISFNYGEAAAQISQVNITPLHINNNIGTGIAIAVLDSGFPNVNTSSAYKKMFDEERVRDAYNFIADNTDPYDTKLNAHGSYVLGIIGGYYNDSSQQLYYVGSAPGADFYLYATEDGSKEHPEEEMNFIRAMERADKMGVDIITASLGYFVYDDKRYSYQYSDMTGATSFVARGTSIAADKGILLMIAQGNEAQNSWRYLLTPADSPKVFSVGGVDSEGNPSDFTSYGPNADKVVKPDASARASSTYFPFSLPESDYVLSGDGTSFATPIATGGLACLLQALPKNVSRNLIKDKMRSSASIYPESNDRIGYGILNFNKTLDEINATLSVNNINIKEKEISVYPNPVKNIMNISTEDTIKSIELYDGLGRRIKNLPSEKSQNLDNLQKGIYYIKITTNQSTQIEKIIKD